MEISFIEQPQSKGLNIRISHEVIALRTLRHEPGSISPSWCAALTVANTWPSRRRTGSTNDARSIRSIREPVEATQPMITDATLNACCRPQIDVKEIDAPVGKLQERDMRQRARATSRAHTLRGRARHVLFWNRYITGLNGDHPSVYELDMAAVGRRLQTYQ